MIIEHAKAHAQQPQLHFLLMGGNNIRSGWETVSSFVAKCRVLARAFINIQNAKLVFCGMVPQSNGISKPMFTEADAKLQDFPYSFGFVIYHFKSVQTWAC